MMNPKKTEHLRITVLLTLVLAGTEESRRPISFMETYKPVLTRAIGVTQHANMILD